jgi:hypothetical protein
VQKLTERKASIIMYIALQAWKSQEINQVKVRLRRVARVAS